MDKMIKALSDISRTNQLKILPTLEDEYEDKKIVNNGKVSAINTRLKFHQNFRKF